MLSAWRTAGKNEEEGSSENAAESTKGTPPRQSRILVLALFQTGHRTLTHLRARVERFKAPLIDQVKLGAEDGPGSVVKAVMEFWSVAPTMMINTMDILVEYRVVASEDVFKHVFLSGEFDWYSRYWPWELVRDVLSRTVKKECIAAPRPFAGVHQNVRDAETEEKFKEETELRRVAMQTLAQAFDTLLGRDNLEDGKKCVLRSRAKCLKGHFALAIDEFRGDLPEGSVLLSN